MLKGSDIAALAGGQSDAEALIALKDFMNRLGCETLCTEEIFPMDAAGLVLCFFYLLHGGGLLTQCCHIPAHSD